MTEKTRMKGGERRFESLGGHKQRAQLGDNRDAALSPCGGVDRRHESPVCAHRFEPAFIRSVVAHRIDVVAREERIEQAELVHIERERQRREETRHPMPQKVLLIGDIEREQAATRMAENSLIFARVCRRQIANHSIDEIQTRRYERCFDDCRHLQILLFFAHRLRQLKELTQIALIL